jgi:hypothetical protein
MIKLVQSVSEKNALLIRCSTFVFAYLCLILRPSFAPPRSTSASWARYAVV